jgi:transcriptional regulator with XRE-family HTH domain
MAAMTVTSSPFGEQLRRWRQHRRLSQLDLALEAEISARHLSFLETGRAAPSREMVLRLAEQLDVPLRERNTLLGAAGFAPLFRERPLTDPAMAPARAAVELVLKGHEPYPALAVDRRWNLVMANAALPPLVAGVAPALLAEPCNVLRLSLHPDGLAPRIANLGQWRAHLLERLRRQIAVSADAELGALMEELSAYPAPQEENGRDDFAAVAVPLKLALDGRLLSLFSTATVFGAPSDLTLAELALEAFFPMDEATAKVLGAMDAARRAGEAWARGGADA